VIDLEANLKTIRAELSGAQSRELRAKRETTDLAMQVLTLVLLPWFLFAVLISSCSQVRQLLYRDSQAAPSGDMSSAGQTVITQHLVSFDDVAQLQHRNQELLAVTRQLTADLENARGTIRAEVQNEFEQKFAAGEAMLLEMKQQREKQEERLKAAAQQIEMLKAMRQQEVWLYSSQHLYFFIHSILFLFVCAVDAGQVTCDWRCSSVLNSRSADDSRCA
jgi:hypothetical protein